jgi:2-polyprenyl-3-methyl-5-hydroxy-6-metoxy-1,4-benzoquinol methylase
MYQHLSQYYNLLFPIPEKLHSFLKPYITPFKHAIDLGCGTGRLVNMLSQYDMHASGIDLDEHMISYARMCYPHLKFRIQNMLDVSESKKYHLMTCFGNTLVHLNEQELISFMKKMKLVLHKEGYLIIQLLNYHRILESKPPTLKLIAYEDITLQREYTYLEKEILFKAILTTKIGEQFETSTNLYPYDSSDLVNILDQIGLQYHLYGNLEHKRFEKNDYYLYIVIHH